MAKVSIALIYVCFQMTEMKKLEERKKKVQAMLEGKLPLTEDTEQSRCIGTGVGIGAKYEHWSKP